MRHRGSRITLTSSGEIYKLSPEYGQRKADVKRAGDGMEGPGQ